MYVIDWGFCHEAEESGYCSFRFVASRGADSDIFVVSEDVGCFANEVCQAFLEACGSVEAFDFDGFCHLDVHPQGTQWKAYASAI